VIVPVASNAKPRVQSVTLWFNALAGVLAILASPDVLAVLPAEWLQPIASFAAVGNIILRVFRTKQPLASSRQIREAKRSGRSRMPFV
jgi:hypothetical protein